jgi:hypothetical protein
MSLAAETWIIGAGVEIPTQIKGYFSAVLLECLPKVLGLLAIVTFLENHLA